MLRGAHYCKKLVPPFPQACFESLKKEKGPTFSDTNFVVLDSVLFSGILVQMNTGSTDGSQQQSSSSNQSTEGKDSTRFFKNG